MKSYFPSAFLLPLALTVIPAASACSQCGCSLSSDWALQGYAAQPGGDFDLRYEYLDQAELRHGASAADRAAFAFPAGTEVQQRTLTRNLWFDLDQPLAPAWSLSLQVPFTDRFHTTVAEGDTAVSTSDASGLGDVRCLVRYQPAGATGGLSLQFGLKLPTGRFGQTFSAGPQAGELLDRGLQLGTGTTDLLAGIAGFSRPAENLGAFAQAALTQPLAGRAGFLPATTLNLNGGLRWLNPGPFTPQLQVNVKVEGREHGAQADTANSGGVFAYVSPGVTLEAGARATAFAFVQLPVRQRVNGLQLEPKWILSLGSRWRW